MLITRLPRLAAKAFTSSAAGCDSAEEPATKTMVVALLPVAGAAGTETGAGGGGAPAAAGRGGGPGGRAGCGWALVAGDAAAIWPALDGAAAGDGCVAGVGCD